MTYSIAAFRDKIMHTIKGTCLVQLPQPFCAFASIPLFGIRYHLNRTHTTHIYRQIQPKKKVYPIFCVYFVDFMLPSEQQLMRIREVSVWFNSQGTYLLQANVVKFWKIWKKEIYVAALSEHIQNMHMPMESSEIE